MPTATTYYKKHKISKGETIAQSLKERFDYGQNPDKTEGGELISSYGCDHMTAEMCIRDRLKCIISGVKAAFRLGTIPNINCDFVICSISNNAIMNACLLYTSGSLSVVVKLYFAVYVCKR